MSWMLYLTAFMFIFVVIGVVIYTFRGLRRAKNAGVQRTAAGPDLPARGSPPNPR